MKYQRYIRQTSLEGFGEEAQGKLAASRVLIVGLGGLGIPVAQYLNAMGVGTLGLVEQDTVDLHNLQRQVLYREQDVGRQKLEVVMEFLKDQNAETHLVGYDTFLNRNNALEIIKHYDLVVDATDNFPTRYLINDACVMLGKPFIYGALHGWEGQVSVFNYQGGPTYRCLFPEMPDLALIPDCNQHGVLGVIPGIVGNLQALESIKVLTGVGEILSGSLLIFDGLTHSGRKIRFNPREENLEIQELQADYGFAGCSASQEIPIETLVSMLESGSAIQLVDVREVEEFNSFHIPGSKNIPMGSLESGIEMLERESAIYFICASGKRSGMALQITEKKYPGRVAFSVKGGIQKYKAQCP